MKRLRESIGRTSKNKYSKRQPISCTKLLDTLRIERRLWLHFTMVEYSPLFCMLVVCTLRWRLMPVWREASPNYWNGIRYQIFKRQVLRLIVKHSVGTQGHLHQHERDHTWTEAGSSSVWWWLAWSRHLIGTSFYTLTAGPHACMNGALKFEEKSTLQFITILPNINKLMKKKTQTLAFRSNDYDCVW